MIPATEDLGKCELAILSLTCQQVRKTYTSQVIIMQFFISAYGGVTTWWRIGWYCRLMARRSWVQTCQLTVWNVHVLLMLL